MVSTNISMKGTRAACTAQASGAKPMAQAPNQVGSSARLGSGWPRSVGCSQLTGPWAMGRASCNMKP